MPEPEQRERKLPDRPLEWGSVESWPAEAPALRPRGLILIESTLTYAGHPEDRVEDEVGEEDDDVWDGGFDWTIAAQPGHVSESGVWHAALIGDVFICRGGWHLLIAAVLPLEGRPGVFEDLSAPEDVEKRLGYWASHVLWDFLVAEGNRQLVSARTGFSLPAATPRPTLRHEMPPVDPAQGDDGEG